MFILFENECAQPSQILIYEAQEMKNNLLDVIGTLVDLTDFHCHS